MSGIASLYDVPLTPQEIAMWSFVHAAHHHDIIEAIYAKNGTLLNEYVLDPFNPKDLKSMGLWEDQHQIMHNAMNAALGYNSQFNLEEMDWHHPEELADWILMHVQEHQNAANVLDIG